MQRVEQRSWRMLLTTPLCLSSNARIPSGMPSLTRLRCFTMPPHVSGEPSPRHLSWTEIILVIQMKKLRHGRMKQLAQVRMASNARVGVRTQAEWPEETAPLDSTPPCDSTSITFCSKESKSWLSQTPRGFSKVKRRCHKNTSLGRLWWGRLELSLGNT